MLVGKLNLLRDGHLVLQVPNSMALGAFMSLNLPGFVLPRLGDQERFNACVVVMTPEETERIGPDFITERGKDFHYSVIGTERVPLASRQSRYAERIFFTVSAPELTRIRSTYGLGPIDDHGFKIVFAARPWGAYRSDGVSKLEL